MSMVLPPYTVARSVDNIESIVPLIVKRLKTRDSVMDVEDLVLAGTKQRSAKIFALSCKFFAMVCKICWCLHPQDVSILPGERDAGRS